jgi:hypothetical protein
MGGITRALGLGEIPASHTPGRALGLPVENYPATV